MPLDPAIIELMHHLSWRPPAIVQEAFNVAGETSRFRARSLARLAEGEKELEKWIAEGIRIREDVWRLISTEAPDEEAARAYSQFIGITEDRVRDLEQRLVRTQKRFRRHRKEATAISREAGEVLKEIDAHLFAFMRREIDALKDFNLFVRAVHAELDPTSRGGPTFDDPDDLERYLASVIAST